MPSLFGLFFYELPVLPRLPHHAPGTGSWVAPGSACPHGEAPDRVESLLIKAAALQTKLEHRPPVPPLPARLSPVQGRARGPPHPSRELGAAKGVGTASAGRAETQQQRGR